MRRSITKRIAAQTGLPRLLPALAEDLTGSDLQSLLLEVYRRRVEAIGENRLMERAGQSALVQPSGIDARVLNRFDGAAFETASGFEAMDLSPACPLGTNQILSAVDQNNVLTTIRNVEVLGDPTVALAYECARRRKGRAGAERETAVRLCGSHRVVRMQPFDFPGLTPHFRQFALVSAGRDPGSNGFEIRHLREHLGFYLRLFRALNRKGFEMTRPLVEISDVSVTEALLSAAGITREEVRGSVRAHAPGSAERFLEERGIQLPAEVEDPGRELAGKVEGRGRLTRLGLLKEGVVEPLREEFGEATFRFNLARIEGLGYYDGVCLRISPAAPDGTRYPIVDGGLTDWTARLLQDKKERLLTSGIGSEFVCRRYRRSS